MTGKISRAFEPFFAESAPNEKRDAIVIYRTPAVEQLPVRGRLRELKKRLAHVRELGAAQQPVQAKILRAYQTEGAKRLPGKPRLEVSAIGANTLPVATVEVTRKTLPAQIGRAHV